MWCCGANESEWCANMHLHDDVERIVWRRVKHAVIGESSIIHNMVNLPIVPGFV